MDIIELALLHYTDFTKFEDLANEMMALEGFTNIRKIGGISDDGIDAEQACHYQTETKTTVFQYSLQENVASKVTATIKKLNDNKVEFSELYIVTNRRVGNKQDIRKKVRTNHQVSLQIIDLSDIKTYLGSRDDIFNRYFPNIDAQLESLRHRKDIFSDENADVLEKSMLKCSLIFTFSESGKEKNVSKHLLFKSILAILASEDEGKDIPGIIDTFLLKFNKIISPKEIRDALQYLEGENWLTKDKPTGKYRATNKVTRRLSESIADIEDKTELLIKGLIDEVSKLCKPQKVTEEKANQITYNTKRVFNLYFKLYGAECCGVFEGVNAEEVLQSDILKEARRDLNDDLANWVVYCLGQLFSRPNAEQRQTLSLWAKAFMGAQLMKLDPMLGEFQMEKLRGKMFVLDTDFVLYSITDACKQCKPYKTIIDVLVKAGCNVVIPDEVVREVANHAASAEGNYRYFKSTFNTIDEEIVEEEMNNIFVKDYYIKLMNRGLADDRFSSYMENYYDENESELFMVDVINTKLKGITIGGDFTSHNIVDDNLKFQFVEQINEELKKTPKAKHRSDEDNYELSRVDANLYLSVLEKNKDIEPDKHGMLLRGNCYLLTNSTISARCAKNLNIYRNIVSNPPLIYSLIEEIGIYQSKRKNDIFDLFANPFLATLVDESWSELKPFADKGVYMKGRELPRLRKDLEGVIHNRISNVEKICDDSIVIHDDEMQEFVVFAQEIKRRGYSLVPSVEKQVEAFVKKQEQIEMMSAQLNAMNAAIKKRGKRSQRYIVNEGKRAVKNLKEKLKSNLKK